MVLGLQSWTVQLVPPLQGREWQAGDIRANGHSRERDNSTREPLALGERPF